jgi:hypothetical protein
MSKFPLATPLADTERLVVERRIRHPHDPAPGGEESVAAVHAARGVVDDLGLVGDQGRKRAGVSSSERRVDGGDVCRRRVRSYPATGLVE